jgi:T4 beta protein
MFSTTEVEYSPTVRGNPCKPNQHAVIQRLELAAWKEASRLDDRIKRNLTFGDFGADHGKVAFGDSRGPAITHLRYATPENWLITRGGPSSSKVDGSIRFAAARIINSDYFAGEHFSWGDEFIFDCSSGAGAPGYPTVWRAVNMNHHMTRALIDVGAHLGRTVRQPAERQTPLQEVLQF